MTLLRVEVCHFKGDVMRIVFLFFILSSYVLAQNKSDESVAFLGLSNVGLEKLNDLEEKKKFLEAVSMEKKKIQDYVIKRILDEAYELYQNGDYEGAATIAKRVLSIDPTRQDAKIIATASTGSKGDRVSQTLSYNNQMEEALTLYQKGEVLEAYKMMQVLTRLSPNNAKAKYWYKKMEGELKDYYISKAEEYYTGGAKKKALEEYYHALEYAPKDEVILSKISQIESEIRDESVNTRLKEALEKYSNGKLEESYSILKEAITINPADERVIKLYKDLKKEIETKYINEGNEYYKKKNYKMAIKSFTLAMNYSENPKRIDNLISKVKDKMKREEEIKRKKEEERKRKEEERRKKEEEEKKKQAEKGEEKPQEEKQSAVSEQNRIAAQQHWMEGIKYMQSGDYQKAKEEFTIAKKLNPNDPDIDAALKRIEQILGGGSNK